MLKIISIYIVVTILATVAFLWRERWKRKTSEWTFTIIDCLTCGLLWPATLTMWIWMAVEDYF